MAAFTPGNIVVYRVGTGAAALSGAAAAVFLDEYAPDGTLVQSIALPTADSGSNQMLTAAGTATSEGFLNTSVDGHYLLLTGYDAAVGTAGLTTSTAAAAPRVVGRVGVDGLVDTSTVLTGFNSGGSIRGVASEDGSSIYVAGSVAVGLTTYQSILAPTSLVTRNSRVLELTGGQLYETTGSAPVGVGAVGSGEPTTSGQIYTGLAFTVGNAHPLGSPYGFFFADLSSAVAGVDTLYVADDGIGLLKFSLVGTTWTEVGLVGVNADDYRGLTGFVNGTTVTLYATRDNGAAADSIVSLIDSGGYNAGYSSTTPTVIATAATNEAFRGIAFAPHTDASTIAIQPTAVSHNEGDAGATTDYIFILTRSDGTADATVAYAVTGTGGLDGTDFVGGALPSGTATFVGTSLTTTVTISVAGDATIESSEDFTITLSSPSAGYVLGAPGAQTGTIVNDDAVPLPTLAISDASVSEGDSGTTLLTYTVTASGAAPAGGITFDIATADGSATAGTDYAARSLAAQTIAEGMTSYTFSVVVNGDTAIEPNETVLVNIANATNATIADAQGVGTIVNDDIVTLSISDPTVVEGDSGTTLLTYIVSASAPAPVGGISFDIATADGSATAGSDYVAQALTGQTIAEGATSYSFSVVVNGDTASETNETVLVNLSNPVGAVIADGQGSGTIVTDDAAPATARIFAEDFAAFTAAGFAPAPAAGQLDSDVWRVVGLSDNANPAYGFTGPGGGDFGRGIISGDPVSAGVYSPAADHALILQPTGAEIDVNGFVEAKIQNTSGSTATSFEVAFDWAYRNSGARGDNVQLSYSTDGINFTVAPAANFTTPTTADATLATAFTDQHETVDLTNLVVGDQGFLYLRWTHLSSTGGGNRDEVGIDNVTVDAGLSSTATVQVGDISFAEGNAGQTAATFTVTRSNASGTASVDYATSNGTATAGSDYVAQSGTVTFAAGETTHTITVFVNGDTANEPAENFFLNLTNPVGVALPSTRATATITNDDTGPVGIYSIQGESHTSPFAGLVVTTSGVVTAVKSNGFYLQDPTGDGNDRTSDAVFVLTTSAPTVVVGDSITVSATVTEFAGAAGNLTTTELTSPTISNIVHGVALPDAVLISTDGTGRAPPTQSIDSDNFGTYNPDVDGIDFYESLEGMRVTFQTPLVVANSAGGDTYIVTSAGIGATGINDRAGISISAGDNDPEKIRIYDPAGPAHTQGDVLNDVTGIISYFGGEYEVDPTTAVTTLTDNAPLVRETTNLVGTADALSIASFNVENLSPLNPDSKYQALANEVVNALHNPDIIGLEEIQDSDGNGAGTDYSGTVTAQKLIDAIAAAGGPTYVYIEVAPSANNVSGGEPNGNIRNGYLYNPERVGYVAGSAHLLEDPAYNGTRKPLIADFTFNGQVFTAADLHSTSRGGSDPLFGSDQPPVQAGDSARTAQATALKAYFDNVLAADPAHKIIVNGDFNGYYYENALTALQAGGAIVNLYDKLPVQERYSYFFDGYYQAFDNILVSSNLFAGASFDVVHYNAGFTDGLSVTDHDQAIATIGLARTGGVATAIADSYATTEAALLHGTVLANDTGGDATLSVTLVDGVVPGSPLRLASGALVTVHADGTFAYDTDGAYAALETGQTATDSFSYTLTGGSTATATITISGITNVTPSSANDTLTGTPGNDSFDLSTGGNDTVSGGAGDDGFFFGAALTGMDHINGGSGTNDQVGISGDYTGANQLVLSASTFTGVEVLAALPGHSYDIVSNDGNVAAGDIFSVYGASLGAADNLTFNGAAETDGSFRFYAGFGVETLTGGAGDDGFYFGPGRFGPSDVVHGGGGSNDQLGLDGDYTVTLDARADVEVVALLAGSNGNQNTFDVTVADSFVAAGETKTIYAITVTTPLVIDGSGETDGNLNIYGGLAADHITGGSGADIIFGAAGGDTLVGGAGNDVFRYSNASQSSSLNFDTLTDFTIGEDTIRIAGQTHDTYSAVAGGQLDSASFDADLAAALNGQLTNGAAVFFTPTTGDFANQAFLVVDANGVAGYQAGEDYVFHMPSAPVIPAAVDFIVG